MKTIHRIMHDVLTLEEYKNWCNSTSKDRISIMTEEIKLGYRTALPSFILIGSFYWHCSQTPDKKYWGKVYERLTNLERKL